MSAVYGERPSFSNPGLELVTCSGTKNDGRGSECTARTHHVTGYCFNHRHQAHKNDCPARLRTRAVYRPTACTCGVGLE